MTTKVDARPSYSQGLDRLLQASLGKLTSGISPVAVMLAFYDWYFHLAIHPSKQLELVELLQENYCHLFCQLEDYLQGKSAEEHCIHPPARDKRFVDESWQQFPYYFLYQSFLLTQNWWHQAAIHVHGVSQHHEDVVDFMIRQILDMFSPSNSPFTNPEIQKAAIAKNGENFVQGFLNYLDDTRRNIINEPPAGVENFVIGENLAVTPGKVVYQNRLIELIQYSPLTKKVYTNPVLITPAWIMKYYILDLTPKHSLVKYLVKRGHTVFMISWKNPDENDRNLGMEDYLNLGIMSAMDAITTIVPRHKIHLVGYCLGGTLSAIAASTMVRDGDKRLASMTLFAAQTDFTEPGELGLFIDESQIAYLENIMWDKGYLEPHQMLGTFQLLRSNDLIWSRLIHDYLLGVRRPLVDLMAWNADATRLPYRMHSEYLRTLFLNNELAEGKFHVKDRPIALADINVPIFVVATERDHVSPWRSVFQINLLTDVDVTFTLTSGGHNVGIVSLPVKKTKRYYRISTLKENDRYIDAKSWHHSIKPTGGSWWPAWQEWIAKRSGKKMNPPALGSEKYPPLYDAPGKYVLQK